MNGDPASLYLDLMKRVLTRELFLDEEVAPIGEPGGVEGLALRPLLALAKRRGWEIAAPTRRDAEARALGRDWPARADTMIGLRRLDNLELCIRTVISENVPGDLVECGVWRGGASIFMRAALAALGDDERQVWLADSFRGLPPPNATDYPADEGLDLSRFDVLAVGADALYGRVSPGGFVIVDDYQIDACRKAVSDHRARTGDDAPIIDIDGWGVYWRKPA